MTTPTTEWEIASLVLRERRLRRDLPMNPRPFPGTDSRLARRAVKLAKARAAKARAAMMEA